MKSLFLSASLMSFLLFSSPAVAGEVQIGVGAGFMKTDPLEVLGSTWTVIPRVGYFFNDTLGLELDVGILAGKTRFGDEDYPYFGLTPRLNVVGKLWTKGKGDKKPFIQPLLVAGIGGFYKSVDDGEALGKEFNRNDLDFAVNAGPGLLIPLGPAHFRTDMRWLVSFGNENFQNRGDQFVNWEWTAGLGIAFGGKNDADNDGIVDKDDQCKDEPEDIDSFQDEDGCPDHDNDNDGLKDTEDECPNEGEDKDGIQDGDGCPETDADEDGVLDTDDTCALTPGSKDAQGCPDDDGDTVMNREDECRDEAGSVEAMGCLDDDEDHVPNYRDMCPDEKADSRANPRYSNGCPTRVIVSDTAIVILEKVFFDTGNATIKEESFELLADVAQTLINFKNIKKIEVEGHTDNVGDAESNLALSNERATSVRNHLIETHTIDAARLEAKGFGQTKPLDPKSDQDDDAVRTDNRRVEFHITEIDKKLRPVYRRPKIKLEVFDYKPPEDVKESKLTVKSAQIPKATGIPENIECHAILRIGIDGEVESVKPANCAGLPRSITRRSMKLWKFEPILVDGKATPHQALFKWNFTEDLKVTVTLDEVSVQPIEE